MLYENPYPKFADDGELNPLWIEYNEKFEYAETLAEERWEAQRDENFGNN